VGSSWCVAFEVGRAISISFYDARSQKTLFVRRIRQLEHRVSKALTQTWHREVDKCAQLEREPVL
jgi:hypothetical protein